MAENQTKGADLFNANIKESFLSEFGDGTQNTYRRIFLHSKDFEIRNGKDLYDFNAKEIGELLYSLNPITFASSATNTRIISSYMYWAIDMELRGNNNVWVHNPLTNIDNEWIRKFVIADTRIYISEKELQQIEDFCTNYQDSVIFRCLFEGIEGTELNELCNLNKNDIDWFNCIVTLRDSDKNIRKLKVTDRCIKLIEKALNERTYHKRNGYMDTDMFSNLSPTVRVAMNDYVVRTNLTHRQSEMSPVNKGVIYHRISTIRDLFGETPDGEQGFACRYLRPKNIIRSGMIWMGKKIFEEKGSIEKEDYENIAKRYNKNNVWAIKEFVNEDMIREVYGE